ncbi:uncharacterized protein LOC142550542 [Primulina tabacum]|uniref:uncharacterized protein LOC142550542 n=1 Tax=Primulina tabacum TaxID=48773 RepID=UPI003F59D056
MLKDCPQWKQPPQGRVFAMHVVEENPDTTLLTAMNAVLDSGRIRSFKSNNFVSYLCVKSTKADINYSVTVPSGKELSASSVVRHFDLELQGHTVYADLIVMSMPEVDIILGIDWLSKNGVLIDFHRRSVFVRPLGLEKFLFEPNGFRNLH